MFYIYKAQYKVAALFGCTLFLSTLMWQIMNSEQQYQFSLNWQFLTVNQQFYTNYWLQLNCTHSAVNYLKITRGFFSNFIHIKLPWVPQAIICSIKKYMNPLPPGYNKHILRGTDLSAFSLIVGRNLMSEI